MAKASVQTQRVSGCHLRSLVRRLVSISERMERININTKPLSAVGPVPKDDPYLRLWVEGGALAMQIQTLYGEAAWRKPMIELDNRRPHYPNHPFAYDGRGPDGRRLDPLVYVERPSKQGVVVPKSVAGSMR